MGWKSMIELAAFNNSMGASFHSSREQYTDIFEEIDAAFDIAERHELPHNSTSVESILSGSLENRIVQQDTVIVMEEDVSSSSSSSSGARHRAMQHTVNDTLNDGETSDVVNNRNDDSQSSSNDANITLQRGLSRLRALAQSDELQRVWVLLLNTLPFIFILFLKAVVDGFFSLLSLAITFLFFHVANITFLSSLRDRRYFRLLQSFASSIMFFNFEFFFYEMNSVLIPMAFMSYLTQPRTFFATLHRVLLVDFTVKILTVTLKAVVSALPVSFLSQRRRRRFFQWIEYTSQVYRYLLPVPQWMRYLSYSYFSVSIAFISDHFFAVIYVLYKIFLIKVICGRWIESSQRIFRLTSVGLRVPTAESNSGSQCTICFGDFTNPVELPCGHTFCEECIGTWLDKEHTCPMCRAIVVQEDNMWKSGETTYSPQLC